MTNKPHKSLTDPEAEIWNAIAAFEKILEALPGDRVSLQTLSDAYEKVGDHTRAEEYVIRLANVLINEVDEDAAHELLEKIRAFDQNDPHVQDVITRIEQMKPEKVMADVLEADNTLVSRSLNIASEISFAWNLLQVKKLTQDEYSKVVHDLSESSTKNADVPVSTLHVLHDMNFPHINDVLGFVSTSCNTPIISLSNFEVRQRVTDLIPNDFIIKRGAIIFELMGNDALVAILNPYDDQLPMDIEELTGKTCHFFLVSSEDFDNALEKIKQAKLKSK